MTDSSIRDSSLINGVDAQVAEYLYRINNRILPREVYRLSTSLASHADRALLADFLTSLQDSGQRKRLIMELETSIGNELLAIDKSLDSSYKDALGKAGVWVDVPKPPEFEDVNELIVYGSKKVPGIQLVDVFPISEWTEAYTHYRYYVRIFAFSEYLKQVEAAAKKAMQKIMKIHGNEFYDTSRRDRV